MPVKPNSGSVGGIVPADAAFGLLLDRRIAEMRRLLAAMRPDSTAAALRTLRDAFPDIPLDERIRALSATRH